MKYNQPFDQPSNPNAGYINGNPAAGIQGSIVPAEAVEYPQREIVNCIIAAGLVPSNGDLTQLLQVFKAVHTENALNKSTNYGTANQWSAQIPTLPGGTLPPYGTVVWFKPGFASMKGGTVFSLNGGAFRPVTHTDLSPIDLGDVSATAWLLLFDDGVEWQLIAGGTQRTGQIPILQHNADWYVNAATGNDTNYDGTSATVLSPTVGPFATPQRGVNETAKYNMNGYSQKVHVAGGDYPPFSCGPTNGVGTVYIEGDLSTPTNVTVSEASAGNCISVVGGNYAIGGFRLACFGPATYCVGAGNSGTDLQLYGKMQFGPAVNSHIAASFGAAILLNAGLIINIEAGANAGNHIICSADSPIWVPNPPGPAGYPAWNVLGAVTFADAFINAESGANTFVLYSAMTGGGNVTGRRFHAMLNGIVGVANNPLTYYPGTVAGLLETGGQYG
jgi:hypothetical protein